MPINDSQVGALLKLLLAQEKDILHMKAHLLAVERAVTEIVGPERTARLDQDVEELQRSHMFHGTGAAITALEQLLAQSLPADKPN